MCVDKWAYAIKSHLSFLQEFHQLFFNCETYRFQFTWKALLYVIHSKICFVVHLSVPAYCTHCRKEVFAVINRYQWWPFIQTWVFLLRLQHDERRLCKKMQHPSRDQFKQFKVFKPSVCFPKVRHRTSTMKLVATEFVVGLLLTLFVNGNCTCL